MMATKPSQKASVSDNIFAGLTFPEVPKTKIRKNNKIEIENKHIDIKRENNYNKNAIKEDNINNEIEDEGSVFTDDDKGKVIINEEIDIPSYDSLITKQPTIITNPNEIKTNFDLYPEVIPQTITSSSVNFTKLYNFESDYSVSNRNIYPDLDSIVTPSQIHMNPLHQQQKQQLQHYQSNSITGNEQKPSLYPTVYKNNQISSNKSVLSSLSNSLTSVINTATSYAGLGNNSYTGYNQVATEQEENRDIEMENYSRPLPSLDTGNDINNNNYAQIYANANAPSLSYNQVDSITNSRLVSELLSENDRLTRDNINLRNIIHQMNNNNNNNNKVNIQPFKGVLVSLDEIYSNRNRACDSNLKYVSCGNCRQWNQVPKLSNHVLCAGCQVVNNCTDVVSQPKLNQFTTSSSSFFNYFGDCFK